MTALDRIHVALSHVRNAIVAEETGAPVLPPLLCADRELLHVLAALGAKGITEDTIKVYLDDRDRRERVEGAVRSLLDGLRRRAGEAGR